MSQQFNVQQVLLFVCFLLPPAISPLTAQMTGAPLAKGEFELGVASRDYHRFFSSNFVTGERDNDWGHNTLIVRIGITDRLTSVLEGLISSGAVARYPDRDYKAYHIGIGLGYDVWSMHDLHLILGAHYSETVHLDRSQDRFSKTEESFFAGPEVQQRFLFGSFLFSVSFAPAFVQDVSSQYPWCGNFTDVSLHNFGFAAGLEILAYKHARIEAHVVYADFWQPRWSVGYIF